MSNSVFAVLIFGCLLINQVCAGRDIPVRKCCSDKMLYKIGFDECNPDENVDKRLFSSWPPVFDRLNNRLIDDLTADDFIQTTAESLDNCPEGEVAVSSTDFSFFSDGSLRLNQEERNLSSGQFCLNQIATSTNLIARYCIRDPCSESVRSCVRKCCPNGMILNETDQLCHPTSLPFEFELRNEKGDLASESNASYIIRDGIGPKCNNGITALGNPFDDTFYLLPNGQIYVPNYKEEKDRTITEFCIDNLISDDEPSTVSPVYIYMFHFKQLNYQKLTIGHRLLFVNLMLKL